MSSLAPASASPTAGTKTEGRPIISVRRVSKRFGSLAAVDDVSLDIREKEFFALLGPSGCGKTTLLRMLAGFETPSEGDILIDGQDVTDQPPNRRPVNMVFQSYAVFPHMSVFDNVGYGLKVTGTPKAEIGPRVETALETVQLERFADRKPDQLSGGQRQRVALARALVKQPRVLLLDEPLSALDAKLREDMQLELVRLQQTVGITFVIVTHDQDEALSMADRIAVMEQGKVRQIASPMALYEYPNSRFVADFIGKMNLFEGHLTGLDNEALTVEVGGFGRFSVAATGQPAGLARGPVGVAVRPEKLRLSRAVEAAPTLSKAGTVRQVAYYGDVSTVFVQLEDGPIINATIQNENRRGDHPIKVGERVWCCWDPPDTLLLQD